MSEWLADFFFGPIQEARERLEADPGLPAYPWLPDGTPSTLPADYGRNPDYPLSFVAAAIQRRFPNLINLDELRRNVQLALKGTPDTRTPAQKRKDAWLAYEAAKERYEQRSSRTGSTGSTGSTGTPSEARQGAGGAEAGQHDGQEQEAGRQAEGPTPSPRGEPQHPDGEGQG